MSQLTDQEKLVRDYLLGGLSEDARREVEERLLTDDEYFTLVQIAEDELTDDYLGGALTAREREMFERHFLATPARREQLRFARAFRGYVRKGEETRDAVPATAPPVSSSSWWRSLLASLGRPLAGVSLVAATLLVIIGGAWLLSRVWWSRGPADPQLAQQNARPEDSPGPQPNPTARAATPEPTPGPQLAQNIAPSPDERPRNGQEGLRTTPANPPRRAPAIVALALAPSMTRSEGEMKRLTIPPSARTVRLQLALGGQDYASYRAVLFSAEGVEVYRRERLRAPGKSVIVDVPARLLARGDYLVRLSGTTADGESESVGSYPFRVTGN